MGELQIFDCEQGSDAWDECRRGLPTASMFATVLAKGRGGKGESKTRAKYLRQLVGERITGEPMENFVSQAMDRGKLMEAEARDLYAFAHDVEPQLVGFIRNGQKGCSPDALIGEDGLLELKSARADILIEHLLRGTFPPEHLPQCHGQIWITGRKWCDLCIFCPRLPTFQIRLYRDESYIRVLGDAIDRFNEELEQLEKKIRNYAG